MLQAYNNLSISLYCIYVIVAAYLFTRMSISAILRKKINTEQESIRLRKPMIVLTRDVGAVAGQVTIDRVLEKAAIFERCFKLRQSISSTALNQRVYA